jgi:predicted Holliday junction resolvase-like endonuclease
MEKIGINSIVILIIVLILLSAGILFSKNYIMSYEKKYNSCQTELSEFYHTINESSYNFSIASQENNTIGNIMYNVNENCKIFREKNSQAVGYFDDVSKNRSSITFGCLMNTSKGLKPIPESIITIKR